MPSLFAFHPFAKDNLSSYTLRFNRMEEEGKGGRGGGRGVKVGKIGKILSVLFGRITW